MQARRQRGCSSRRPFDPGLSSLASRHHSTAPPHPKRYDKRYEDKFLENIRLHRRPTKTLWWPRGWRGGTSHGPYPVAISSEGASTTQKVGTTNRRAVPGRRRKSRSGTPLLLLVESEHSGERRVAIKLRSNLTM